MSRERVTSSLVPLRDVLGLLALAATLALTSPGVQIAHAADGVVSTPPASKASIDPALVKQTPAPVQQKAGPSCSDPGTPSVLNDALVEYQTHRLLRQILQRAGEVRRGPQSSEQGIVLNGRGYNYRPTPVR